MGRGQYEGGVARIMGRVGIRGGVAKIMGRARSVARIMTEIYE